MAVILPCYCKHSFQDQCYGLGMRLHNLGKEDTSGRRAICTVCGAVKHIPTNKAVGKETGTNEPAQSKTKTGKTK